MPWSDTSGDKRFHGWTNWRLRQLGAPFAGFIPGLAWAVLQTFALIEVCS